MKPVRTGLVAGLLAGAAGAANKLVGDWREGGDGSPKVLTGANGKAPAKVAGLTDSVGAMRARRAAKRAEANRPPWVVAPAPAAPAIAAAPARPAPAPAPARRLPSLDQLRPPSAKSVGASVGKYAVKQAGKAITKAAADRVGKAIEVIEVLEKVVASAAAESAAKPDLTPSGPGAGAMARNLPPAANVVSVPVRPGPADVPSTATPGPEAAAEVVAPASPPEVPKPRGTLVSVRKFERGPRVVVGPGVKPNEPEPAAPESAGEVAVAEAVEAVVEAMEATVTDAAPATPAKAKPKSKAAAKPRAAAKPKVAAPRKAAAKRAPVKPKSDAPTEARAPGGDTTT